MDEGQACNIVVMIALIGAVNLIYEDKTRQRGQRLSILAVIDDVSTDWLTAPHQTLMAT